MLVVLDQQGSGGAAGEDLDRADAGLLLQRRQGVDVRLGAGDIESDVAPGLLLGVTAFPVETLAIDDRRILPVRPTIP